MSRSSTNLRRRTAWCGTQDLIAEPPRVVERLAETLAIDPAPVLLQPTVAGMPSSPNSSFVGAPPGGAIVTFSRDDGFNVLTALDRRRISARLGDDARRLGYDVPAIARWQTRVLNWTN